MPKALDVNIIVRFFVDDGSKEVPIACAILSGEFVEVSSTTILETEWVLRSIYKIDPLSICEAFEALLSLENVSIQDEELVLSATDAHRLGGRFRRCNASVLGS